MNIQLIAGKAWLGLKKATPTIAVFGGIGLCVFGTAQACKATLKVDAILEEAKAKIDAIHKVTDDPKFREENPELAASYTEESKQHDILVTWVQLVASLTKLYGPAALSWIIGVFLILYSHFSMKQRAAILSALCVTYGKSLNDYRAIVAQTIGEEKERDLYYGLSTEKVEEIVVDPETGKETKHKVTTKVIDTEKVLSPYAVIFDKSNPNYDPNDPSFNADFIADIQRELNDRLYRQGWLFLNDARIALGYKPIPEGQIVGWTWDDKTDCPFDTDNLKIDLNISHISKKEVLDFRNGYTKVFVIDFDCKPIIDDFCLFDKSNRIP